MSYELEAALAGFSLEDKEETDMYITLAEYARRQGRRADVARSMARRGGFKSAKKVGRDWFVDEEEAWPDRRRIGEEAGWMGISVRVIQLCPFCGGEAGWVYDDWQAAPFEAIRCQVCGASSSRFYFDRLHPRGDAREKALAAWNRRADDSVLCLRVDTEIMC